jgi:uncharacterized membrane protein
MIAILAAIATILDRLSRLWPALAAELQAARDRATAAQGRAIDARAEADRAGIAADLDAAAVERAKRQQAAWLADADKRAAAELDRARARSEAADATPKGPTP